MSAVESISPKRRAPGLGRGLSSLLGDTVEAEGARDGVRELAIAEIAPNPEQPRRHFDETALDELARSIADHGVLQPIIVRPFEGRYLLVAGERRWRASQRAGKHSIPALVREFSDITTFEVALIENIQREQLNAIEEGEAYRRLIDTHGHSQETLAALLNKSRSHIANLIRLGDLPNAVRQMVANGRLSMGHARALVGFVEAEALANRATDEGLSVRAVEAIVKKAKGQGNVVRASPGVAVPNADIALLERQLGDLLGLKVAITHDGGTGRVAVDYATLDQLDMICQRLSAGPI